MAIIGATDVGTTRQDLVSAVVQETLKAKSILIPTVLDYSSSVPAGSKSVYIPRRAQFTAETKVEDTDLTAQAMIFTQDQLTLSHVGCLAEVEIIAELQSAVNVEAEVIKEAAEELAKKMDDLIIVQLKLASSASPDHILDYANSPTDTLQVTDIVNARMLLNKQNVPMGDRYMVISPDQEAAVLQLSNFIQAERYGNAEPVQNGEVGKIFGFKVLVHPSLSAADALFYHKMHSAFAVQLAPSFESMMNLPGIKKQYLLHTIAGSKVLQGGKAGVYYNGTGS
jgi:HK97 family phage major capsid protein